MQQVWDGRRTWLGKELGVGRSALNRGGDFLIRIPILSEPVSVCAFVCGGERVSAFV